MSGFSPDWLALREEADHRSRDTGLAQSLAARLAASEHNRILDLGCGTGSNLRALAPLLGNTQTWHLVDQDKNLLAHARTQLRHWADFAENDEQGMTLYYGEQVITVRFEAYDLGTGLGSLLDLCTPDLVTASALFDLVGIDWIKTMVQDLTARKTLFYTVLTYDGRMQWFPPHALDEAVRDAFNAHQTGDKGLGRACGPQATAELLKAFNGQGYHCDTADSAWIIHRTDEGAFLNALAEGIAIAVEEQRPDLPLSGWHDHIAERRSVLIGHLDFYAWPALPD